jgi:hypothetical protein
MKRSPLVSLACSLAFWPVMLLFSAAVPANHGKLVIPVEGALAAPVVQEQAAPIQQTADYILPSQNHVASLNSGRPLRPGIPCLSSYFDDEFTEDQALDNNCSDAADLPQHLSLQFGRRFDISAMLGKTDGIRFDYRLGNGLTLNSVAGYAVKSDKDPFNPERRVVGLSADTGVIAKAWNLNAYMFERQEDDSNNDMAIGGTLLYLQPEKSLLLFLDYNPEQDAMNAVMVSGAWQLPRATTLSATFDVRNSPVHSREKKYLQHSMAEVKDWAWILPAERIWHYTQDNQHEVTTLGLSLSHAFSQRLKFSGNMAVLDITGPVSSLETPTASASLSEYDYHVKLTGEDFLIPGINGRVDLHHNVSATSRTSSALLKTKYAINRLWNISPQLRTEHRKNTEDDSVHWEASPAVKMEYRWKQLYGFQVEAGGKWTSIANADAEERDSTYFISLGYQINF